jgi:AcrR family transcriptional regulator
MKAGERHGLDRQDLVRVALELLDDVGLDGLTMRSLADRLGVKAASLYWHLRDKDELAELLLEAINCELPDPESGLPWREQLERQAWAWRQVLLRHRDAARLAMGRFVTRPVTLRHIEHVLGTLRSAGFSDADAANAGYLIANFVPGFVAEETTVRPSGGTTEVHQPSTLLALERARLEVGPAKRLTIRADPTLPDLYLASSDGPPPDVHAGDGTVRLAHTRGRKPSTIVLNASVPWEIHLASGASHLTADLRGLQLQRVEVGGGSSELDLTLPVPSATVPITLKGGISKLSIHRPAEVPVRLEARGGISRLTFDHEPFKSAGELTVQTPGYEQLAGRYMVTLRGGASRVQVDTAIAAESSPAPSPAADRDAPLSLASLPASQYPNLAALTGAMLHTSMDNRFRFGIKVILDGLERQL